MNVFFVSGAPKSGTTWLQRILDAHPQVSCSGEGHFIDRFVGPMAKLASSYNESLGLEAQQVYEGRPYYKAIGQSEFDELARAFILPRLKSRSTGPKVRWFGDKTPGYAKNLPDLLRIFPEARFINIVRDPRDVTVSYLAHSRRAGLYRAFDPEAPEHRDLVEKAVNLWIQAVRFVDAFAAAQPDRVCELRYRDLHGDPLHEVARAFRFLGVEAEPSEVERIVAATSFEAMTGRKPGAEDPAAFLRVGKPGDWETKLNPEAARAIEEACGDLMRKKGFLPA